MDNLWIIYGGTKSLKKYIIYFKKIRYKHVNEAAHLLSAGCMQAVSV